jgi:hypothetical protein
MILHFLRLRLRGGKPQLSKTQSLYCNDKLILGFPPDTVIVWDLVHCIFNAFFQVKEGCSLGFKVRLKSVP